MGFSRIWRQNCSAMALWSLQLQAPLSQSEIGLLPRPPVSLRLLPCFA